MDNYESKKNDNNSSAYPGASHLEAISGTFHELRPVRMDMEEYISDVKRAIIPLLKPLGVAHMEVEYTSTGSKMLRKQYQNVVYLHENDADEDEEFTLKKNFSDLAGGQYIITYKPHYNKPFTDVTCIQLDILSDVLFAYTDRFRMSTVIHRMQERDLLTGIPNLSGFFAVMLEKMQRGTIRRYNAYFLNCNNFRLINKVVDTHGGDEVMRLYAQKLASFCEPGEIIARPGGDNYVALIHKDRHDEFLKYTEGIQIKYTYHGEVREFNISAGVGCYQIPHELHNPGEIMTPITVACNTAKKVLHRHVAYFNEGMEEQLFKQMRVQNEFFSSLKQGEFVPFIQPKVNMNTGEIVGGEVLARWNHNGEFVLPADFISPLEANGMISSLDMFMLRETCRIIHDWLALGYEPPRLSVNLSRWNLNTPGLIDIIDDILTEFNIDTKYLEIELTESLEYNEYIVMIKLFEDLISRGITTAIDDFGSGFSSVNVIRKLDVNVLKIDRTFLTGLENGSVSKKDIILLDMIITATKAMGIEVIAEGVENPTQMSVLLSHGCEIAQGFMFHKPMPVNEFENIYFGDKE